MKLKYIKEVDEPVKSYGWLVNTGEVADVDDWQAKKALKSGAWEECAKNSKVTAKSLKPDPKEYASQMEIENQRLREINAKLERDNKRLTSQNYALSMSK